MKKRNTGKPSARSTVTVPLLKSRGRLDSFGHALTGVLLLVRTQPNAQIHLGASLLVVGLAVALGVSNTDWALLALAMGGVWAAEALNTAVEAVVDLVSPEWHPLARDAKDLAAGGVLLATVAAVAVGLFVLAPPLLNRLT